MSDFPFSDSHHVATSESLLLRAAQRHDHGAENDLVRRYEPLIRRIVRRLRLPQGCDPEDIAQEARIGLVHAIRCWRADRGSTFSAYAARCATNQAVKGVNAAGALKQRPLNTAAPLDLLISHDTSSPGVSDIFVDSDAPQPRARESVVEAISQGAAVDVTSSALNEDKIVIGASRSDLRVRR